MAPTRSSRAPKVADAVLLAAVEGARTAIADQADAADVGDHEGYEVEGERALTHYFTCLSKGYRGWRWAVTITRVPRGKTATVSEVVLLPGAEAILAPTWVPWADRIAPGDLGDSDTLPYRVDDPRLEPGYAATDGTDDDEDADRLAGWELGLGRVRVLSPEGREDAAQRWYDGPNGPLADPTAHASCQSCGFFLPLSGSLRQAFGVCANEWSPSDGQVVSLLHGCGAHSETDVEQPVAEPLPELILDEIGSDAVTFVPRDLNRANDDDAASVVPAETESQTVPETGSQTVPEAAAVVAEDSGAVSPSADQQSVDAEPVDAVPDAEPVDAEPVDAEPVDAVPVDAESADT